MLHAIGGWSLSSTGVDIRTAFEKVFGGEERQKLGGRFRLRVRDVRLPRHTIQWHTFGILSTEFRRVFIRLGLGSKSLRVCPRNLQWLDGVGLGERTPRSVATRHIPDNIFDDNPT